MDEVEDGKVYLNIESLPVCLTTLLYIYCVLQLSYPKREHGSRIVMYLCSFGRNSLNYIKILTDCFLFKQFLSRYGWIEFANDLTGSRAGPNSRTDDLKGNFDNIL